MCEGKEGRKVKGREVSEEMRSKGISVCIEGEDERRKVMMSFLSSICIDAINTLPDKFTCHLLCLGNWNGKHSHDSIIFYRCTTHA